MIAIGIDVGGTSIKGAAIKSNGEVLDVFTLEGFKGEDGETTLRKLGNLVNEYIASHTFDEPIVGIGLGVPGLIDSFLGVCCASSNLGWTNLEIGRILSEITHLPVKITNDANAAALGEAKYGAGNLYDKTIMVTLGTGVGGGIVIGGKLYEGNEGKGAEIGHITLELNGRPCGCGRRGCWEQYASATGLTRDTKEAMAKHPESLMNKMAAEYGKVSGRIPFECCKLGDKTAIEVIDQYIMYLGEGLLNYCNIFRPDAFILSGGIANQGDYLTDKVQAYLEKHQYGYPNAPKTKVLTAQLGYDSGKIGAAALFFN